MAYSTTLPDIDVLFSDGNTRAAFNTDAVQILWNEVINIIKSLAIATLDTTEIAPILNSLPISSRQNNGQFHPVRTSAQLESCCTFALSLSPKTVVLTFDISVLLFTLIPNPRNFSDMSLHPFPVPRSTPAASADPASGSLATPPGTVPVTNIFNYTPLPLDVRLRFDHHADTSKMMTRRTMDIEFDSSIQNMTLDPTGRTMRTTLSYLDHPVTGDRLITRQCCI